MLTLFRHIGRFLNHMDRKAVTSLVVTLCLLGFLAIMLVYGTDWLGIDQEAVNEIMFSVSTSPYALVGVVAVYSALALLGFPQMLLFAGTVAVFGAVQGIFYSWTATMISSTLTFLLGHAFGSRFVKRLSAGRAASMIEVFRRRGLLASMIVRWTPSAPFIVINAICGAAHIPLWKFLLGTAIGILPKILFIALFTEQVDDLLGFFQTRDPRQLAVIGLLVVLWLIFLLFVRWLYMRLRRGALSGLGPES